MYVALLGRSYHSATEYKAYKPWKAIRGVSLLSSIFSEATSLGSTFSMQHKLLFPLVCIRVLNTFCLPKTQYFPQKTTQTLLIYFSLCELGPLCVLILRCALILRCLPIRTWADPPPRVA